jgi:hypothetical protein
LRSEPNSDPVVSPWMTGPKEEADHKPEAEPEAESEAVHKPEAESEADHKSEAESEAVHKPDKEMASRSKPTAEVIQSSSIGDSDKTRMNHIFETAFPNVTGDYVQAQMGEGVSVCVLRLGDQIEGLAFAVKKTMDTDPSLLSPEYYLVHSVAISPEMQGKGYCKNIMGTLVKEYGSVPMYLNVRTTAGNANIGGIKCYERNGFHLIPCIAEIKDDGPNSVMIRDPATRKTRRTRKTRKTRSRRRKRKAGSRKSRRSRQGPASPRSRSRRR